MAAQVIISTNDLREFNELREDHYTLWQISVILALVFLPMALLSWAANAVL